MLFRSMSVRSMATCGSQVQLGNAVRVLWYSAEPLRNSRRDREPHRREYSDPWFSYRVLIPCSNCQRHQQEEGMSAVIASGFVIHASKVIHQLSPKSPEALVGMCLQWSECVCLLGML